MMTLDRSTRFCTVARALGSSILCIVLHHTGEMWRGIDNATVVKDDGLFFIAIYNDQGFKSHLVDGKIFRKFS